MLALHVFQSFLVVLLLKYTESADLFENCDYNQNIALGELYYVYNPEYPELSAYTSCRWSVRSPPETIIVANCSEVNIPQSADCNRNRLFFSLMENQVSLTTRHYCGDTSFTIYTSTNSLVVGFITVPSESKFVCTVSAMQEDCQCGVHLETKIVGGHNTGVNEYPFMAVIVDQKLKEAICGASIISQYYALAAAHCLNYRDAMDLGLQVGDHDLSTGKDTKYTKLYQIVSYKVHLQFNQDTLINDITILKTEKAILFNFYIGPICLPFRYTSNDFNGQTVTALGWDLLNISGGKSNVLQEVDLSIVDTNVCNSTMPDHQICTFTPNKDTCLSESGGPIIWKDPESGRFQLIGIISYGEDCATKKLTVNTRVTSYLPWILSETTDAEFCKK